MNRHLIAIEIRIERGADQGMNLDRFSFDQDGLEGLNAEPVQRRRSIEKNRMILDHLLKNVPYDGILPLNHFLRGFNRRAMSALFEPVVDERLEELEGHLLRQSALMQLQLRPDNDDRTAGVVHTLA